VFSIGGNVRSWGARVAIYALEEGAYIATRLWSACPVFGVEVSVVFRADGLEFRVWVLGCRVHCHPQLVCLGLRVEYFLALI